MPKTGIALLLALLALALPAAAQSVKINYFSNFQSVQGNLGPGAYAERSSSTLEGLEILPTYRCGNALLIDPPPGLTPEDLAALNGKFVNTGEIRYVENPTSLLLAWPPGSDAVTAAIYAQAPRGLKPLDLDAPRARLKTGYVLRAPLPGGGYVNAFSDAPTIPPGDWFKLLEVNSRLKTPAGRVEVKSFAKMFGGSGLLAAMARRGYMDNADVNVGLAWIGADLRGLSAEAVAALWRDTKTGIYAFTPYELPALEAAAAAPGAVLPDLLLGNLADGAHAAGGRVKNYTVKEIKGVKIGFFFVMDDKVIPAMLGPFGARLTDPAAAAAEIVKTLAEKERADLVVMLGMFVPEDLQALLAKVPGVDIVINSVGADAYAVVRASRVKLENWDEETGPPALLAELPAGRMGELQLEFADRDGGKRLTAAELGSRGLDYAGRRRNQYDLYDESGFMVDITSGAHLLPDPAALWGKPKRQYTPLEIWNLGAVAVNERTKAELSFLRIRPFSLTTAGGVPEPLLRRWLARRRILTGRLDGAGVRALLKQADFDPVPVTAADPDGKFTREAWLAAAGITPAARVGGIPLNDNELYQISFTEDLLAETRDFPALARLKDRADTGLYLDDIVAQRLKAAQAGPGAEYHAQLRRLAAGTPAPRWRWRLNVKEAALQYAETQVANTAPLSQVPNPKLQALDQTYTQSAVKLALEARRGVLWDDTRVSMDYGKIILRPAGQGKVVSETADQLLFENELRYAAYRWDKLGGAVLGPLVSAGYDTELTEVAGLPRRKIAVGKAGVKIFEGRVIQDFYTAAVMQRDFTYHDAYTKWAWETGTHIGGLLGPSGPEYAVDVSYKRFSPNRLRSTDLKMEFELEARLKIKLFSDLHLAPFADFYAAKGMIGGKTARNYLYGISLDYSRLFKLRN